MTPYSRFRTISHVTTTALVLAGVFAVWPTGAGMIAAATGGLSPAYWLATAGGALGALLVSLTLSSAIFPLLFRFGVLRRLVLGQHYLEGLWVQAEHDDENGNRLTLIQVRPQGYGYAFSGQIFDRNLAVMSQSPLEIMRAGPLDISYFYATLPGSDGERSDSGRAHLSFRPFRGRALAYTGHGQSDLMRHTFRIEGVKVRKWSEMRRLLNRDRRNEILAAYWEMFFNEAVTEPEDLPEVPELEDLEEAFDPPAIRRPVIVETGRSVFTERRNPDSETRMDGPVIQRRRASDWRSGDTTPTADRIRARMIAGASEADDDADEAMAESGAWEDDSFTEQDAVTGEEAWDQDEARDDDHDTSDGEDLYEAGEDDTFEAGADEDDEDYEADDEDGRTEPGKDQPVLIRNRYARR
ncbi:MAG: hypothetical protein ACK4HR_01320 [Hyphomonas sp.]|jgi:hypothetical protein